MEKGTTNRSKSKTPYTRSLTICTVSSLSRVQPWIMAERMNGFPGGSTLSLTGGWNGSIIRLPSPTSSAHMSCRRKHHPKHRRAFFRTNFLPLFRMAVLHSSILGGIPSLVTDGRNVTALELRCTLASCGSGWWFTVFT